MPHSRSCDSLKAINPRSRYNQSDANQARRSDGRMDAPAGAGGVSPVLRVVVQDADDVRVRAAVSLLNLCH